MDAYINASEISCFINQNKFEIVTPFLRLWKRLDNNTYSKFESKNKNDNENSHIDYIDKSKELKNILGHEFINDKILTTYTINDIKTNINLTNEKIDLLEIDNDKKNELKTNIISLVNTNFGTLNEKPALKLYIDKFKVKLDTSQKYTIIRLNDNLGFNFKWFIGGKIDAGIIDPNDCDLNKNSYTKIIEVKSRTKCFFKDIREYEMIQIQMYMYIFNVDIADLVEYFNNKIKVTLIKKNKKKINTILKNIYLFINKFELFLKYNEDDKFLFYSMTHQDKEEYLRNLYLNEMNY